MKRLLAILLLFAMTLSFASCVDRSDTVTYYYIRRDSKEYQYGQSDAVIAGENRVVAGHADDLRYLLTLYFQGPTSENLKSPFPIGTQLESVAQEDGTLIVKLSNTVSVMEGMEPTLACACLAQTCFGLTDAREITIVSNGLDFVPMTFTRDSLLLVDDSAVTATEESE